MSHVRPAELLLAFHAITTSPTHHPDARRSSCAHSPRIPVSLSQYPAIHPYYLQRERGVSEGAGGVTKPP
eukprot:808337-Prymnesium_polylepis.1